MGDLMSGIHSPINSKKQELLAHFLYGNLTNFYFKKLAKIIKKTFSKQSTSVWNGCGWSFSSFLTFFMY